MLILAKKKPKKSKPKAAPKVKEPAKPAEKAKVTVTPKLMRLWLTIRKTYNLSHAAFSNTLSLLSEEEANMLYDLVKHALYKGSVAEILREHPELKPIVKTDDDRLCMHDIYEHLSWRLGRKEPMPSGRKVIADFRQAVTGRIMP